MTATDPLDLDGVTTRFIVVDGVAIHLGEVGAGPRGMLLLHHFWGNVATWRHVLVGLGEAGIHAIAPDRPGFGWGQRPDAGVRQRTGLANPYNRSFAAHSARQVAIECGLEQLIIVGSSLGGTVALELVLDDHTGVDAMVLLSPAINGDVGPPAALRPLLARSLARSVAIPMIKRRSRTVGRERAAGGWADPSRATSQDLAAYSEPMQRPGWADGIWQAMTTEAPPRLGPKLSGIEVPTTVVTGDRDRVVGMSANKRTAAAIGADLVVIDNCGHTPQEECPQAVVDLLVKRATMTWGANPPN